MIPLIIVAGIGFGLLSPYIAKAEISSRVTEYIFVMQSACLAKSELKIEAQGEGGILLLKKGEKVEGVYKETEIPSLLTKLQSEVILTGEADKVRDCMRPHTAKILDSILGAEVATRLQRELENTRAVMGYYSYCNEHLKFPCDKPLVLKPGEAKPIHEQWVGGGPFPPDLAQCQNLDGKVRALNKDSASPHTIAGDLVRHNCSVAEFQAEPNLPKYTVKCCVYN